MQSNSDSNLKSSVPKFYNKLFLKNENEPERLDSNQTTINNDQETRLGSYVKNAVPKFYLKLNRNIDKNALNNDNNDGKIKYQTSSNVGEKLFLEKSFSSRSSFLSISSKSSIQNVQLTDRNGLVL